MTRPEPGLKNDGSSIISHLPQHAQTSPDTPAASARLLRPTTYSRSRFFGFSKHYERQPSLSRRSVNSSCERRALPHQCIPLKSRRSAAGANTRGFECLLRISNSKRVTMDDGNLIHLKRALGGDENSHQAADFTTLVLLWQIMCLLRYHVTEIPS